MRMKKASIPSLFVIVVFWLSIIKHCDHLFLFKHTLRRMYVYSTWFIQKFRYEFSIFKNSLKCMVGCDLPGARGGGGGRTRRRGEGGAGIATESPLRNEQTKWTSQRMAPHREPFLLLFPLRDAATSAVASPTLPTNESVQSHAHRKATFDFC